MSLDISNAFIKQFERETHEAYQRMGSKLRPTVRSKNNVVGASAIFPIVGKGAAQTKSRAGIVPTMDVLARTVWGEARGEGQQGMTAVAAVIINRVNFARAQPIGDYWWGNSIIRVCQKPLQFSCWNANDPNLPQLQNVTSADPAFAIATRIAAWAASGALPDPTQGATHYHALTVMPSWALGHAPTAIIGRQVFYKLV